MDLWLLECDYKKLISKVAAKKKKSDGEAKKMNLNHIIKELQKDLQMIANFKPNVTIRPQLRRKIA